MADLIQNQLDTMLLTTKLHMPLPKTNLVVRPSLLNRLSEGLRCNAGLFLVSAPAGYGKTTLVAEWINSESCCYIWLSLDEKDNDPVRFLTYLLAAFRGIHPQIGRVTQSLLESEQLPQVDILITPLINDLDDLNERIVMVLDDYYLIRNRYIRDIVQLMIDYRPLLLNLVLITHEDFSLAFAGIRMGGEIIEVRVKDFCFSEEETALFFGDIMKLTLEDQAISLLNIMTEGWIAGLQLVALAIRGRTQEEISDFLLDFSSNHRYIIDYLVSEILYNLPKEIRGFLRQTAVLDRLCAPLCRVITGREDSRRLLELLEHDRFFLLSLNDQSQWYRYHQLFASSLRSRISREERQSIHQKAACWYEKEGYAEDAAEQIIAATNCRETGHLIESSVPEEDYCRFFESSRFTALLPDSQAFGSNFRGELPTAFSKALSAINLLEPLSAREAELLQLVAAGLSNEEIARKLAISLGTTKWHMHNIFQKLGVNSRIQAAIKAKELSLA